MLCFSHFVFLVPASRIRPRVSGGALRSSHSALRRPRTSTHAPRLALRSYTPAPCSGRDGSCASSPHSGPRAPTPGPRPRTPPSHPASRFGPRTPARTPVPFSGRCAPVSRSGPVFRAVHSGLALRPRPAPTFCPALWVADLKGGFWKEAFAFRAQAPVPAFWPCVPALTTRSSRPGSSHSALRRPRTSTHAPRLALRSRVPGGALRSCAPVPCSGRRTPVPCSDPAPSHILPRVPALALGAADSGGGSCALSPHSGSAPRSSHSAPLHLGFALRLLHSGLAPRPCAPAPAFPPRIPGGGFEGRFSGDILERRIPGGGFEGGFSGDILERRIPGGVLERRIPGGDFLVRPPRRVSELRILANQQNKIYL